MLAVSAVSAAWSARTAASGEGPVHRLERASWCDAVQQRQSRGRRVTRHPTGSLADRRQQAPPLPPPASKPHLSRPLRFGGCARLDSANLGCRSLLQLTAGQGGGLRSPALLPPAPGGPVGRCTLIGLLCHHHLVEGGAERRELLRHSALGASGCPDPAAGNSSRMPRNAEAVRTLDCLLAIRNPALLGVLRDAPAAAPFPPRGAAPRHVHA